MAKKKAAGARENPAVGEGGSVHVQVPQEGTVWLRFPDGALMSLDNYREVQLVVYGSAKVRMRAAGSELDGGLVLDTTNGEGQDGETWRRDVYVDGGFVTVTMNPGTNREALGQARALLDKMGLKDLRLSGAVFGSKVSK